nr:DegQ family serine endoprotease [Telmatospirillum sp. J64-1]
MLSGLVALALLLTAVQVQARPAPESFADLAERLQPAVVNISTTQTMQGPERMPETPQFPPGSPFEDFFREFFENQPGGRPDAPPRRSTSLGSGFIIDPEGYVVTNNHVIADADEISVILHDDTVLKAEIVGRDAKTDLALLKVNSNKELPSLQWGDSDATRVGDWVLAIGNPFGLGGTVTAGIVSARARDINAGPYDDFIQTDASINRGNSGGPMFNMNGEVIGINTAIFSPSGGSIGIGFAVPSALAKPVIDDLREHGRARRGWLGVRIQSVTEEIAESLGLEDARGALVASVTEGGPAEQGGIRAGDVILQFAGREVPDMRRLPRIVAETPIDRSAEVVVWRDGRRQTLNVVVGELREEDEEPVVRTSEQAPRSEPGQISVAGLGMSVATVTPQIRERFSLAENANGVVVVAVESTGAAAEKGIRPGDLILEVSQEQVTAPNDVVSKIEAARKAGRRSVLLLIENERGLRFVALRVDNEPQTQPGPQPRPQRN